MPVPGDTLLEALDHGEEAPRGLEVLDVLQNVVLGPDQLVRLGQIGDAAVPYDLPHTHATSGFAETPEKASDPPHCSPIFNSDAGSSVRRAASTSSSHSCTIDLACSRSRRKLPSRLMNSWGTSSTG